MKLAKALALVALALGGGGLSAKAEGLVITGPQSSEATIMEDGTALLKITKSGQYTVKGSDTAWIVVVGGGGGGGIVSGGGGGGGAVVEDKEYSLKAGTYDIVIGKGGSGSTTNNEATALCPSTNGCETSAFGITAAGGGAGGGRWILNAKGAVTYTRVGTSGASGGGLEGTLNQSSYICKGSVALPDGSTNDGAVGSGTFGTSNNNSAGGGGGGAGGAGYAYKAATDTSAVLYPTGGVGVATMITGTETWFGGGGSGGVSLAISQIVPGSLGGGGAGGGCDFGKNKASAGADAEANTGGGGGGAGSYYSKTIPTVDSKNLFEDYRGGNGADGIVIIRYKRMPEGLLVIVR